jgi:hypothetical protein
MKNYNYQWLWLIPLLLLFSAISVPRLGWDGLWYDEIFSVMNARGAHYGPPSLQSIWTQVSQNDPHQALGYPYLLAAWGLAVGWSEFALRAFSYLSALLALAVTYQLGKRLASPEAGVVSAMILAISTYFINYSHELRSFTFVALAAASLLLSYHALLQAKDKLSRPMQALFVLSGTALLWSHYYTGILLAALGLYHLLFVKKDRRWLQIAALAILIGLLFLPEVPSFIQGYTNYKPTDVELVPLSAWGVVSTIVYFIGNNFAFLTILSLVFAVFYTLLEATQLRMLIFISLFAIAILLVSNQFLNILEPSRMRYAIFLWPLLAVWLGTGLNYLSKSLASLRQATKTGKLLRVILPLIWLANAAEANYRLDFNESIVGDDVPRLHLVSNALKELGSSSDFLVFYNGTDTQAFPMQDVLKHYLTGLLDNWAFSSSVFNETDETTRLWALAHIEDAQRIWYGVNRGVPLNGFHEQFVALIEEDFILCGTYVDSVDLSLDLYARSEAFCPSNQQITQFGSDVTLRRYEQSLNEGVLHLDFEWKLSPTTPADTYSLGVYVMPQGATELLAQGDSGFPNERNVLMSLDLDLSSLAAGQYDIWIAVYHWETGERLLLEDGSNLWLLTSFEKN